MFIFQWIRYSNVLMFFDWERGHQLSLYAPGGRWGFNQNRRKNRRSISEPIWSIIWTRKNDISFKSSYIQALKWRKNRPATLLKKRLWRMCFLQILQNIYLSLGDCFYRYSNFRLKLLCDAKSITALFYFLNISSKNLKWKQHFYTDTSCNYQLLNMAVW